MHQQRAPDLPLDTKMRKKTIIYFLLISFLLFVFLEIAQRVRSFCITKSAYSLYYPFNKPKEIISIKEESFFRQPYQIAQKGKGVNILFIGGSSTFGVYNDNLHTFPYLLGQKMPGISCLNAGRGAFSSDAYLEILKKCLRRYCIPQVVVFYTGYNDLFYKAIDKSIGKSSKFYSLLERYSFLLLSVRMKFIVESQLKKERDLSYRAKFVEAFQKNILDCINFAKSNNIKVVLMPEVVMAKKFSLGPNRDYRWYGSIYKEIPIVLEKMAVDHGCIFLDPREALSFQWERNFIDPVHLTDKGNEILSDFILQNLGSILSVDNNS